MLGGKNSRQENTFIKIVGGEARKYPILICCMEENSGWVSPRANLKGRGQIGQLLVLRK